MANSRIIRFPNDQSGKKARNPEQQKLSRELLKELSKDPGYQEFQRAQQLYKQIGEAVSRARKRSRLSTAELAARLKKSEAVVRRMERGEYKQYTIKLLQDLARETGTKLQINLVE